MKCVIGCLKSEDRHWDVIGARVGKKLFRGQNVGKSFEKLGEQWATDLAENVAVGKQFKRRSIHESNPCRTQTSSGLESTFCAAQTGLPAHGPWRYTGKNRHYRWKEICTRHWLEKASGADSGR